MYETLETETIDQNKCIISALWFSFNFYMAINRDSFDLEKRAEKTPTTL